MWEYNYTDELYHYGVKGMKWGVHHDLRNLAAGRRNRSLRKIDEQYRMGKINKAQRKASYRKANDQMKKFLNDTKNEFERSSSAKQAKMQQDISKQALKEVPNNKVLRGARKANDIIAGYQIGNMAATAVASLAVPGAAPIIIPAAVGASVAVAGRTYLINKGLDKAA